MGNKVLFVVTSYGETKNKKIDDNTKKSIIANLGKEDAYVFIQNNNLESELYFELKDRINAIVNDVDNFDYVCLINNGSILSSSAKEIFDDYQCDREDAVLETYLPLILGSVDDIAITLNKHIWNSMIASEAGILDLSLANKQIDSTIFGAFVPVSLFFDPNNYNKDLKYYQQYHMLNNFADNNNFVVGIPKITLTVNNWDYKLESLNKDVKIENFNLARENWMKKKEVSIG